MELDLVDLLSHGGMVVLGVAVGIFIATRPRFEDPVKIHPDDLAYVEWVSDAAGNAARQRLLAVWEEEDRAARVGHARLRASLIARPDTPRDKLGA